MPRFKNRRSGWAAVVLTIATLALPLGTAQAYQTFNSHKLTFGVSGQRFWLDTTAAVNSPAIHDGVNLWNATATPVSYTETAVKAQSRLDFYHPAHPELP